MNDLREPQNFATTGAVATHAAAGAHQQIVRIPVSRDSRWYTGLLGASIVVNIISMMVIFWFMQEKRVDEEYHIQTQSGLDRAEARIEQLEKAGPMTIIVKHEISK